jgi:hypothetical protein
MFDRKYIKAQGLASFKRNYWPSVLAGLFASIGGGMAGGSTSGSSNMASDAAQNSTDPNWLLILLMLVLGIAFAAFVGNMLSLGSQNFFLKNRKVNADADDCLFGFRQPYLNKVKVIFFTALRIALWTLLFIIPGIIKAYEYRLVGYIVSENPNVDTKDALEQSKALMTGNKWAAFVYDLSFIGWILLVPLTFGLLGIFYVVPYKQAANAELYAALAGVDEEAPDSVEFDHPRYELPEE